MIYTLYLYNISSISSISVNFGKKRKLVLWLPIYREEYTETQKGIQQKIIQATELIRSWVKTEPQTVEANMANHCTAQPHRHAMPAFHRCSMPLFVEQRFTKCLRYALY